MKRLSISVSVIVLAIFVLLGSGGFTVGKMICGGNDCSPTYTLGKAKDCCALENKAAESLSCCCELVDVSYSLDQYCVSEKVNVSAQQFSFLFPAYGIFSHLPATGKQIAVVHRTFTDTSPPDPQAYLHFIGSLLL